MWQSIAITRFKQAAQMALGLSRAHRVLLVSLKKVLSDPWERASLGKPNTKI